MTPRYFFKHAVLGLMALIMVSSGLSGCGGDDDDDINGGSTLSGDLRLGAMSDSQRETFCRRVTEPGTVCEQASNPDQTPAETKTPLQVCLDSFTMLPDCTVAKYEACLNEAKKDACGAAATSACQELTICQGRTSLGCSDLAEFMPDANPEDRIAAGQLLCAAEMASGIGAIVWAVRRHSDGCEAISVFEYCDGYTYMFSHTQWIAGCMPPYCY